MQLQSDTKKRNSETRGLRMKGVSGMGTNQILAYLYILGLIVFLVTMGPVDGIGKNPEFSESILGKLTILISVGGTVGPWIYVLEKMREEKNKKWFWRCFLFPPITPYYLLRVRGQK